MLCRHVFGKISSEFRGFSRVFVNFAGFRGFTWNSRLRDRAKYQKTEALNIWLNQTNDYDITLTMVPISQASIGSLSPKQPVFSSLWLGSSHVWNQHSHAIGSSKRNKADRAFINVFCKWTTGFCRWANFYIKTSFCGMVRCNQADKTILTCNPAYS